MHAALAPAHQALFDQAPVAMAAFGLDRRLLAASDRWLAQAGLRREEALGRDAFEVHPELPDSLMAVREPRSFAFRGSILQAAPLRGPEGKVQGVVATLTELPHLRLDEALEAKDRELRRSRATLEAFLEHAPFFASIRDLEARYLYLNSACEALLRHNGLDPGAALGRSHADYLPPEQAAGYGALLREVAATGRSLRGEHAVDLPEGPRILEAVHFPILDAQGDIHALGTLGIDVTVQRERERRLQELAEALEARNADLDQRNRELEAKDRALRDGAAMLQGFLEHLPCNAWIKAPDGRLEYLNAPAAKVFETLGFGRGEVLGRAAWEFYPPEWAERSREQHRLLLEAGGRLTEEVALPGDWGMAYTRIIHFPIHAGDGSLRAVAGLALDLTEERRREEELRALAADLERRNRELEAKDRELKQSRSTLEAFLDRAPCLAWLKDAEGRVVYMNSSAASMLRGIGIDPAAAKGRAPWEVAAGPQTERARQVQQRMLAGGGPEHSEIEFRVEGRIAVMETTHFPLRREDGTLWAVAALAVEVTERKRREEELRALAADLERRNRELEAKDRELRESRATLMTFMDHAPCTVWIKDPGEHYLYLNEAAGKALAPLGLGIADVLGRRAEEVYPPGRMDPMRPYYDRLHATGEVVEDEISLQDPDGARTFRFSLVPLRAEDGTLKAIGGLGLDLTERKRREKELQALALKLERRNRDLEDFTTVASHDLHEPLRKILTFTDRLLKRAAPRLEDRERQDLDRIHQAAGRMRVFIDDLLDYSRVDTGETSFAPVDLGLVAREVLADLEARLEESRGAVELGPLPVLQGDRTQLKQLLQNLLANALKYRRPGHPPRVRLRSRAEKDRWVLEVEDEGIGFEPQYAERIFGIFQRLHTRSEYEGTGVGLALCRRIAERHGGSIAAEGRPGQGATFRVELPR